MVVALAAEFGTNGVAEFSRPLVVKKTPRCRHAAPVSITGIYVGAADTLYVTCVDSDGDDALFPFVRLSFTDRLRVLRRATRYVEKIVRDR